MLTRLAWPDDELLQWWSRGCRASVDSYFHPSGTKYTIKINDYPRVSGFESRSQAGNALNTFSYVDPDPVEVYQDVSIYRVLVYEGPTGGEWTGAEDYKVDDEMFDTKQQARDYIEGQGATSLTINFTPALTGIKSELWYEATWNGSGEYFQQKLPDSVDGVTNIAIGVADPELDWFIKIPSQTIGGVSYAETRTETFHLYNDQTFNITLTKADENGDGKVVNLFNVIAPVAFGGVLLISSKKMI